MKNLTQLVLLTLTLLLVGFAVGADECLDYSYANTAANTLATNLAASSIPTTVNDGVAALWKVVSTVKTPFLINVYFGSSTSDFWMIKYCGSQANLANQYCVSSQSTYIAYVKHSSLGTSLSSSQFLQMEHWASVSHRKYRL